MQDELGQLIAARRKALGIPEPTPPSRGPSFSDVQGGSSSSASSGGDDLGRLIAERRKVLGIPEPEAPGVLARAASKVADFGRALVDNPVKTISESVVAPIESAFTAAVAPGVGEVRPDLRLSKGGNSSGRAIDTSAYDAQHGGITPAQRTAAGVQAITSIAAPAIAGSVSRVAAPVVGKVLGKAAGLAAAGGAEGAAFNPDDPAAGALAGGAMSTAIGGATAGAVRGKERLGEIGSIRRQVNAATPLDENVVERNAATAAADAANYGRADAEAAAVGGTTAPLRAALEHPLIAPLVEKFRKTVAGANATDAAAADAASKLLTKKRRGLQKKSNVDFDEDAELQIGDITDALKQLRSAMAAPSVETTTLPPMETAQSPNPPLRDAINAFHDAKGIAARRAEGTVDQRMARTALERHDAENVVSPPLTGAPEPRTIETDVPGAMPSRPMADAEHARMLGERTAFNEGAKAAVRIMRGSRIAPEKLDMQGEAALIKRIGDEYSPGQAAAFKEGLLGGAQGEQAAGGKSSPLMAAAAGALTGGPLGPLGGIGGAAGGAVLNVAATAGRKAMKLNTLSPVIRALDAKIGNKVFSPADLSSALEASALAGGLTTVPGETPEEKRLREALEQAATWRKR
jgi:hypothetical protein